MRNRIPPKLLLLRAVLCLCGLAALGTVVFVGLGMMTGGPRLSHEVIASAASPNGHLRAVLTRISGGAGNAGYLVDVQAAGHADDTARVANIHAAQDDGEAVLDMVWTSDRTLELRTPRGVLAQLEPGDVTVAGQPVTVLLKPQ